MEEPTAQEQRPEDFYRGVNNVAQKLDKQKEFRKEDSNRRRKAMADKFAEGVMKESVKLLKRKRTVTPRV
ncbi:TPA: hypothetical protein N0F65_005942 [Lagenidium giganteum]|uniref:Uncharacterized protein n=1 Tax=Lagenidium giganteum TaxID=4803 RepID=A0AAV2ZED4_9STRA|nr:TPA: hypothetical protein N0F65_005942 [Lagenidium giganteum]